jgi:tetratricopeptide (TPR) repeat protein
VAGDYASASDHHEQFALLRPEGYMAFAAVLAVMTGEGSRVSRLLDLASAGAQGAQTEEAFRSAARAALAAMDGRRAEALPGFREALRLLNSLDARLEASFVALAMGRSLGSDHPEARKALEAALATFEQMGSEPMIGQVRAILDAVVDAPAAPDVPHSAPPRAQRAPAGEAAR